MDNLIGIQLHRRKKMISQMEYEEFKKWIFAAYDLPNYFKEFDLFSSIGSVTQGHYGILIIFSRDWPETYQFKLKNENESLIEQVTWRGYQDEDWYYDKKIQETQIPFETLPIETKNHIKKIAKELDQLNAAICDKKPKQVLLNMQLVE